MDQGRPIKYRHHPYSHPQKGSLESGVFDTKKSLITYHDSIIGTRRTSNALKVMRKFFKQHWEEHGKELEVETKVDEASPLQENSYDCGVFVCENAEMITKGIMTKPRQAGMKDARRRIMKEIYLGKLITERRPNIFEMVKVTAKKAKNRKMTKNEEPKHGKNGNDERKKEVGRVTANRERIDWPKSNSPEWERLDGDLAALLRTLYAPAEIRAKNFPNIIYGMCRERFGIKERKVKRDTAKGPSRRQIKCKKLREEITTLKKAYLEAPQEQKDGIQELQKEKLRKLRLAKRAETIRQNRKKFTNNCKSFLTQPYDFARNLLSQKEN